MSGTRFLDDLARTLAEPMPRRRAVRMIGASIAAVVVPGLGPRVAFGAARSASVTCTPPNPYKTQCIYNIKDARQPKGVRFEIYCCGPPKWQYECDPDPYKRACINLCPGRNPATGKSQFPCTAAGPDERGIIPGDCCPRPEFIGCTREGKCIPNCKFFAGPFARQCGSDCCQPGELCRNGKCIPCPHDSCTTPGGATICCELGTKCCFNNRSAVCCGRDQVCHAANQKQATCTCKKGTGTKCGSDCCGAGETCCGGLGTEQCCKPGETCTSEVCCPNDRVCPTGQKEDTCCRGQNEFCFFKADPDLTPLGVKPRDIGTCKRGCTPGNTAGRQCCGSGYKPNKSKTRCVPA
jgi:hypothetical protein